jgi:hypothetical protein
MAARVRTIEQAYRMAIERDAVLNSLEPTAGCRSPERAADMEIELD